MTLVKCENPTSVQATEQYYIELTVWKDGAQIESIHISAIQFFTVSMSSCGEAFRVCFSTSFWPVAVSRTVPQRILDADFCWGKGMIAEKIRRKLESLKEQLAVLRHYYSE